MRTKCETCKHRKLMDLDSVEGYTCTGFRVITPCINFDDYVHYTCEKYEFSLIRFISNLLRI